MINRKTLLATAAAVSAMALPAAPAQAQSDPYLGQMMVWGGNFCPRGWFTATGSLLPISSNTALFSLLGTTYGGDGRTTFALPDMRGRAPIAPGTGPGLSTYVLGQRGGVETVTLNETTMPSHTHTAIADANLPTSSAAPDTNSPNGNSLATYPAGTNAYKSGAGDQTGMTVLGSIAINNTGGSQAHENRSPYIAAQWCIAGVGVFPSRN